MEPRDIPCGADAPYKHGLVWMCLRHWRLFRGMGEFWTDKDGAQRLVHTCADLRERA